MWHSNLAYGYHPPEKVKSWLPWKNDWFWGWGKECIDELCVTFSAKNEEST